MNTSLKWIKDLVPGLDCTPQEYMDAMTLSGSKVEGYENMDEDLDKIVIGQRKGLGIAFGHPVFVTEIRPETNEVVLGENRDVFTYELDADHINFMSIPDIKDEMLLKAKIRYSHSGSMCKVTRTGEDTIHCEFLEPVRAVTPGQAVVLYDGEYVAGGGTIL